MLPYHQADSGRAAASNDRPACLSNGRDGQRAECADDGRRRSRSCCTSSSSLLASFRFRAGRAAQVWAATDAQPFVAAEEEAAVRVRGEDENKEGKKHD